jgi:hypothetical protein
MSNEETGKLIDLVAAKLRFLDMDQNPETYDYDATAIVGELQSKYQLTPIESETK